MGCETQDRKRFRVTESNVLLCLVRAARRIRASSFYGLPAVSISCLSLSDWLQCPLINVPLLGRKKMRAGPLPEVYVAPYHWRTFSIGPVVAGRPFISRPFPAIGRTGLVLFF